MTCGFYTHEILLSDRNGMDLMEAEDIKKRWPKYTEELYKKIFKLTASEYLNTFIVVVQSPSLCPTLCDFMDCSMLAL